MGDMEWQKCMGGSLSEGAFKVFQSQDGGYIVAGYTRSDDDNVIGNHGEFDYWIVKLKNNSDFEWRKCFGGRYDEGEYDDQWSTISPTSDGGYILSGLTWSNDGDVSGNHGEWDCWVVKIQGTESGDLIVDNFSSPLSVPDLKDMNISWLVKNQGLLNCSGTWSDSLYLSKNSVFNGNETLLYSDNATRNISSGSEYLVQPLLKNIPIFDPGTYYLMASVNKEQTVSETNYRNNFAVNPIIIGNSTDLPFNETEIELFNASTQIYAGLIPDTYVTGDLPGNITISNLQLVQMDDGPFANMGYLTGRWDGVFDSVSYSGTLSMVLVPSRTGMEDQLKGYFTAPGCEGLINGSIYLDAFQKSNETPIKITMSFMKLGTDYISASDEIKGNITINSHNKYLSIQGGFRHLSFSGNTSSGDYSGPLHGDLTQVILLDPVCPAVDTGFSIFSYLSQYEDGTGYSVDNWNANSSSSKSVRGLNFNLDGISTGILEGSLTGRYWIQSKKNNVMMVYERSGKGDKPKRDLKLDILSPKTVSPGQTYSYEILVQNRGNVAATNLDVIIELSPYISYVTGESNFGYIPETHEVRGYIGTLPAYNLFWGSFTVEANKGLPNGTKITSNACVRSNMSNVFYPGINCHTDKQKSARIKDAKIFQADLMWTYLGTDWNDGAFHVWLGYHDIPTKENFLKEKTDWGKKYHIAFSHSGGTQTLYKKLRDGLIEADYAVFMSPALLSQEELTQLVKDKKIKKAIVFENDNDILSILRMKFIKDYHSTGPVSQLEWDFHGFPINLNDILNFFATIIKLQIIWVGPLDAYTQKIVTQELSDSGISVKDPRLPDVETVWIGGASRDIKARFINTPYITVIEQPIDRITPEEWEEGVYFLPNVIHSKLITLPEKAWLNGDYPFDGSIEGLYRQEEICEANSVNVIGVTPAHDPNAKYGPGRYVKAGDEVNYTVEYENEGEGIAYGVYFTDTIKDEFDTDSISISPVFRKNDSRIIAPPGTFDPTTRTITWYVGTVDPKEGGYANITLKVNASLDNGTTISNNAIVYFPSVPEITPTNSVVSKIGEYLPPTAPILNYPSSNTPAEGPNVTLSWICSDPNDDSIYYDIYLGKTHDPQLIVKNFTSDYYSMNNLSLNTTYFWEVRAHNTLDLYNSSEIGNFTVTTLSNPLKANFTGYPTTTGPNEPVNFIDQSTGDNISSWIWNFGDGSKLDLPNNSTVIHEYEYAGQYDVSLSITNPNSSAIEIKERYISVTGAVNASFSIDPMTGSVDVPSIFTDFSTGHPLSWMWDFGDGVIVNTSNSVVIHTYGSPGTYSVRMNATNWAGRIGFANKSYVIQSSQKHIINATADDWTINYPPGKITYPEGSNKTYITESKPGADLTDVMVDNSSKGSVPSYTFTNISSGHDILTEGTPSPGQIHVFINATPASGKIPLSVRFRDQSLGDPTSWYWQFGDGMNSTEQNPVHIYNSTGTFTITLKAYNNQTSGTGSV